MNRPTEFPPSFVQSRLWAQYEMSRETRPNLEVPIWIDGTIDICVLRNALRDIVNRHEILRTTIKGAGSTVVQRVQAFECIEDQIDITIESAFGNLVNAAKHRFDLRSELPVRFHLGTFNRARQLLLVIAHPAAMDAWSVPPFLRDMHVAYTARRIGRLPEFDKLPFQYADWAMTLDIPPTRIDVAVDRRPSQSYQAAALPMRINPSLHQHCVDVARDTGTDVLAVLQAGLIATLTTYTASREVCIATITDGRASVTLRSLIGPFAIPIVLRVDTAGNPSFRELITSTRAVYLDAHPTKEMPCDALVGRIPTPASNCPQIAQLMLALRPGPAEQIIRLPDAELICKWPRMCAGCEAELFLDLAEYRQSNGGVSGLEGLVWYDAGKRDRTTIENVMSHFMGLLAQAVVNPHIRLADLAAKDGRDDRGRSQSLQVYVRPSNPTEARLIGLWERLVGLHRISVKDVLVDVGGDAALLTRFADEIVAWCGERLPVSMFAARATVASVADELVRRLPRVLVARMQTGDPHLRRPLFLLHGDVGGGGYYMHDLLPSLGPNQPLFALHPHGVTTPDIPPSIEEMAEEYIACIRRVRSHGPYHLSGYCNAGLVAYEIARRLTRDGEEVSSLVLIGTALNLQVMAPGRMGDEITTAAGRYRPEPYDGAVSLLWPMEERGDCAPDLGWRSVCDRVELTCIPGSVETCITEHIDALAVELNRRLMARR
jgi:hypothetical protein